MSKFSEKFLNLLNRAGRLLQLQSLLCPGIGGGASGRQSYCAASRVDHLPYSFPKPITKLPCILKCTAVFVRIRRMPECDPKHFHTKPYFPSSVCIQAIQLPFGQ